MQGLGQNSISVPCITGLIDPRFNNGIVIRQVTKVEK